MEPADHRGLLCACTCLSCGRDLQAHLGQHNAWHFQHHVDDPDCNPQPMTLLHAFVRDELAQRRVLRIPAKQLHIEFQELGRTWARRLEVNSHEFEVLRGEAECPLEHVQPDVVYHLAGGATLALEVRYTHAVDDEKQRKLRSACSQSVEFDVSDLPASGIGAEQLETLLLQPHRWRWLVNTQMEQAEWRFRDEVRWVNQLWSVPAKPSHHINVARPAVAKLRKAQSRMAWAAQQLTSVKSRALDAQAAARWLGEQDKVDRVAVACAALGLQPANLPDVFSQTIALALGHHPYSWQVVVFMKFGIGAKAFTSHDAARWAELAMPDRTARFAAEFSNNGFNRTAAALHCLFLSFEAQGMLKSDLNKVLEDRAFSPRFRNPSEMRDYLEGETGRVRSGR